MLQPTKKIPTPDEVLGENKIPTPQEILGDTLKKKESTESTSTIPENNSESVQTIGSLDGVGSNGFPAIDKNLGVPGLKPDLKTVEQLANPPKSNTDSTKPIKKFEGLIPDKTKGFYRQGEENVEDKKYIDEGFSNKTEYVAEEGKLVPKTKTTYVSEATKNLKANYAKEIGRKSISEYDPNLTEENLQREKEQSGVLNTLGKVGKYVLNATGESLSAWNEALGGDEGYFTIDQYEPLQDQKKQAKKDLQREGLPITEEAIQKRAEDIFRKEDRIQQIQKRVDANLPEDYDREGIWKELKLDNLKNNDKLRSAVATIDINKKQIDDFNKYAAYVNSLPKEKITQDKVDKYNKLLAEAQDSSESLEYYQKTFPKLLKEVKSSDELLDVMKFNYNDYEKAYSNITGLGKTIAMGSLKLAGETANYTDQILGREGQDTGYRQAIIDVANEELDKNTKDKEQYIRYKAKDINSFSDGGSFMAQLGTEQLPVYATLVLAPEIGLPLLGSGTAGEQFRNMEVEEMQPFAKQTTFGQKLATAYLYGSAETLFERLGTVSVLKNIEKSIARASNASRKLIYEGAAKESTKLAKRLGLNTAIEGGTEYLTAEAQIGADKYVSGKNISSQQANERRFESTVAGGLMGGSMTLMGGVWGSIAQKAKLYSENKDIKETKAILSQIDLLSDELKNNPNLNAEDKKIIYDKMNDLTNKSFDIVIKNSEKGKNFSAKENQFLVDINVKQDQLKQKFEELKNSNISTEQKELLVKDLNNQYAQLEKDRNSTLKGEFETIPDIRKIITFQKKEEDNLKDDQALINKAKPQAEVPKQSENKKVIIPDEIKDEHSRALEGHQESIADLEKKLAEEKALPWLKRDRQEQKWIEEDIKFHKESAKMLEENPVQYYKDWIENDKERHNRQLKEKFKDDNGKTYKELLIEKYGSDKYEDVYSGWIESINDKIAKLEDANKPQAEVQKPSEAEALKDVESTKNALIDDIVLKNDFAGSKNQEIFFKASNLVPEEIWAESSKSPSEGIAEAYHKAKQDGSNPKLVKAVEELLGNTKETPTQQAEAEKVEKTKYRIAELNNELEQNRIRGEKGEISNRSNKEIKAEIAELESKLPKEEVVPTKESNVVEGSGGVGGDVKIKYGGKDKDLKGNPQKQWMKPTETSEQATNRLAEFVEASDYKGREQSAFIDRKGESVEVKLRNDDGKWNWYEPKSKKPFASFDNAKDAIKFIQEQPFWDNGELNKNGRNDAYFAKVKADHIKTELENGNILEDINDGKILAKDAAKIIESAGLKVPKDIADQSLKETTKSETNEATPTNITPTNENVQSRTSDVGESRTTKQQSTAKENLPSSVERGKSEAIDPKLKHAREQIEKGVLQWSGDMSSPRIDLGLSWADIRKGESDIKNGKENTVPAKRLIEALDKAKQEGGYHYKYGTGGESQRGREFVSLEDVQRATNEIPLTDSELEQINREQEQLAKEYENYFNSLNEKEQTEIRENYENRPTVEQGVSTKTTEIGEGKNDVSNEKTPSRKEKRIKAVEASIDDLANALKDLLPSAPDTEGLRKQGLSQDDLIDFIAKNAKLLASATITIDEAIRQVIEHLKSKGFDLDVDENLVKEKLGVEKPKSKNKNPLREKSSEEIADELGISHDDYLDLKGLVANEPSSGIFNEYLSAETIADVFGDEPTNNQQYEQMVLLNAVQHGNSVLEKARSIFGENYMSKTLEFLQNVKLGNFEKAMVYAALENEIDTLVKSNPSNKVFLATQRLIYADSQANLRNSSKGLNAGRLRRIHNAIKNGYDIDKLTIGLIKPEQQEAKQILKDAIPTGDNLNKASEQEENTEIEKPRVYTQQEFEVELKKAVQASVGKSRNDLSKKGKDIADKIRRLKLNKDVAKADLSLGAYDLAIEAIAQLVEKGSTVAQAIKNVLSDVKYKDIDADKLRQDILGVVNTPRIKDVVKQALIDAGFSREITVTKNAKDENGNDIIEDGKKVKIKETKEVLDWNKLTGRMNSVEALKANVEGKLKEQGYTDSQIEEISNELESEYKRLTEYIADKALTELERRNQIPKPVNRKSDLDRLVDYHNKGLFGESAKGYERLINKIVGITKREQEVLDKIESEIEKIKNLREVKIDGSFPDAQSIESQASYIAKSIRNIIAWANLVNARIDKQAIEVLSDIAGISRAAVLGNLYNALQNIYSNNRAGFLARKKFELKGYWTPELNDALNELKRAVTSDVLINRGLDFGDVVSPFSHHSIFIEKLKDYIEKKYPEGRKRRMIIGALNTFEGRLFLNVMDSRFKSKIVNIDFVMNLVDVLTSERAGKSKMTKEEAVNFVSESLTGVNLEKAKVLAKKFIDDVNAMKEGTLLKNEDNIKRLAFDIVRENLTSGNNFTMDEINDIYQASMKSGGANIGHESNNIISESLKNLNNWIEKKVEDAMKEKDYDKATKYATYAFISKNITYPYMSGGFNWVVLEAEAGTPLGLATGAYKSYKNKNIDLLTDVGRKRMKEDLVNKRDAESKLFRGIWGTSIGVAAYLAYYGLQAVSGVGDDDEENKRISNKYLREHPEQRKIFDKFLPEVYAVSLAVSDKRLSKYLLNKMGYKTDQNDNVLTLLKSLQNKNSSTPGALGVLLGQIVSTPGAWRILRDSKRLFRELQGEPMAQTEQRVTSFLNGYFKGALVDYLGLRPGTNYDLEKVKKEIQNKKTDFTNYTNGIANDINSGKITKEDAAKLVNKKYEDNDELLDKAEEIIQNSVNDKEIREGLKDADIWYMEMHNEKDIRAKAYIYYQNELKNNASKTDKNFDKYMDIALYGIDEDYYKKFIDLAIEYKDVEEQKSKKKPIN